MSSPGAAEIPTDHDPVSAACPALHLSSLPSTTTTSSIQHSIVQSTEKKSSLAPAPAGSTDIDVDSLTSSNDCQRPRARDLNPHPLSRHNGRSSRTSSPAAALGGDFVVSRSLVLRRRIMLDALRTLRHVQVSIVNCHPNCVCHDLAGQQYCRMGNAYALGGQKVGTPYPRLHDL
jgi:hypothetical protein